MSGVNPDYKHIESITTLHKFIFEYLIEPIFLNYST